MPTVYVLAGNAIQYSRYRSKIPKSLTPVYVAGPSDLKELPDYSVVLAFGNYQRHPAYSDIKAILDATMAKIREVG